MYRTDDPVADFDRYDREQAKEKAKLPHCDCCGCVIYDHYWNINGEIYCEDCLNDEFRRDADDYEDSEDYDGYDD